MRATIFIADIRVECLIGVRPHERTRKQPVRIDARLSLELPEIPERDELEATVDYSALHGRIVGLARGSSFNLIETLAARIAELCLEDARVLAAEVTVEKPEALASEARAGVTIRKGRRT